MSRKKLYPVADEVEIVPVRRPQPQAELLAQAVGAYLAGRGENTARNYTSRISPFLSWLGEQPEVPFAIHLRRYIAYLQGHLKPRSVQAHINTIRGLIRMAAVLEPALAAELPAIDMVKPPAVRGEVQGKRLTAEQRQRLIDAPGIETHKGRRDTAILALLSVCGLRRSEVCNLKWGDIQEIDSYKVLTITGKHGRTRLVKLPAPLWERLQDYAKQAGLVLSADAPVFVPVAKGNVILHRRDGITPHAIYKLAGEYVRKAGLPQVRPHDLRRTAALLARRGGAAIEQVQLMLGHAAPQTTSHYIGEGLNLADNAVDYGSFTIP